MLHFDRAVGKWARWRTVRRPRWDAVAGMAREEKMRQKKSGAGMDVACVILSMTSKWI
jgi:hypothetical protein